MSERRINPEMMAELKRQAHLVAISLRASGFTSAEFSHLVREYIARMDADQSRRTTA